MVASRINPAVVFPESKQIEPEDIGHPSAIYELDVFDGESIAVVLGKPKYLFTEKNVIYMPIYAVSKKAVRSQIGVFELESGQIVGAFRDGEIVVSRLTPPLLYHFATESYIRKLGADPKQYVSSKETTESTLAKPATLEIEPAKETEEDRRFKLHVPLSKVSEVKRSVETALEEGIFVVDREKVAGPTLPEETEDVADGWRKEYRESAKNTWIEKHMRNNHYRIQEIPGDGDCYFTCIKNAFERIGRKTTVDKLRALLANEATDEVFQNLREFYLHYETILKRIQSKMNGIQRTTKLLKKQLDDITLEPSQKPALLEKAKEAKESFDILKGERQSVEKSRDEDIGYMKGIETLDQFRAYVRTQSYWADEWAISTLERILRYKTIVLSEQSYKEGAVDNVMKCGIASREIESRGVFTPEYYIMVSYSGNHYDIITYRERWIFRFSEIPHDMKMLILNKCLEKNAGVYYLIQDFRNYKSRFGIDEEEGRPRDFEDEDGNGDLYDDSVHFIVHSRAPNEKNKPGKPDGEKLPENRVVEFLPLSKIPEWRKKLDDQWMGASLKIRHKTWSSITHYMEGAKYRVGHPDIYEQFSIESQNPTAKDLKLAKSHKGIVFSEKEGNRRALRADVDYALGRDVEERDLALRAKFKDNADMRALLLSTKNALLLVKEKYGEPAEPDHLLMRIRKELQTQTEE